VRLANPISNLASFESYGG